MAQRIIWARIILYLGMSSTSFFWFSIIFFSSLILGHAVHVSTDLLWTWCKCWLGARRAADLSISNPSPFGKEVEAKGCAPVSLSRLAVCFLSQRFNFLFIFLGYTHMCKVLHPPQLFYRAPVPEEMCSLIRTRSWWSVLLARCSQVHVLLSGSVLSCIPVT